MKYRGEQKISNHLLEDTNMKEEIIIRDSCFKFIKDLPLDVLKRLVGMNKVDEEYCIKEYQKSRDEYWMFKADELKRSNCFEYTFDIDLNEN